MEECENERKTEEIKDVGQVEQRSEVKMTSGEIVGGRRICSELKKMKCWDLITVSGGESGDRCAGQRLRKEPRLSCAVVSVTENRDYTDESGRSADLDAKPLFLLVLRHNPVET